MQPKRRSVGFILTILCTFTLLLAACRAGTPSSNTITNTTRLNLRMTPGVTDTTTPGVTTPGTTVTTPAEYTGQIPTEKAWVGLSTTGKRVVAFVTDGAKDHQPTFAQWFRGPVTNGVVDATAPAKSGADRLQATLTKDTATGTVTFADGKSLAFTANMVPTSDPAAGLYRSEHEVNNQRYVAGWVVLPTESATGTATPSIGGGTVLPRIGSVTPSTTETATPSATETTTPSATETVSPSTTGMLHQGGAILNEQTHTILPVPPLTQEQINAKQVSIPNMANFKLVPCQQNLC